MEGLDPNDSYLENRAFNFILKESLEKCSDLFDDVPTEITSDSKNTKINENSDLSWIKVENYLVFDEPSCSKTSGFQVCNENMIKKENLDFPRPSRSTTSSFQVCKESIPCAPEKQQENYLINLSVTVYDQTESNVYENTVLNQVDEAVEADDLKKRKKDAERELKLVQENIGFVKGRLHQIENSLSVVPTDLLQKEAPGRSGLSVILKEKEDKLQSFKRLEAREKALKLRLEKVYEETVKELKKKFYLRRILEEEEKNFRINEPGVSNHPVNFPPISSPNYDVSDSEFSEYTIGDSEVSDHNFSVSEVSDYIISEDDQEDEESVYVPGECSDDDDDEDDYIEEEDNIEEEMLDLTDDPLKLTLEQRVMRAGKMIASGSTASKPKKNNSPSNQLTDFDKFLLSEAEAHASRKITSRSHSKRSTYKQPSPVVSSKASTPKAGPSSKINDFVPFTDLTAAPNKNQKAKVKVRFEQSPKGFVKKPNLRKKMIRNYCNDSEVSDYNVPGKYSDDDNEDHIKEVDGKAIDFLVKTDTYKHPVHETSTDTNQDDYVLSKLFKKSGVHSALKHDSIVDSSDPGHMIVQGEASRVAKEAKKALRESQKCCSVAGKGVRTWTGQNAGSKNVNSNDGSPNIASTSDFRAAKKKKKVVFGTDVKDNVCDAGNKSFPEKLPPSNECS